MRQCNIFCLFFIFIKSDFRHMIFFGEKSARAGFLWSGWGDARRLTAALKGRQARDPENLRADITRTTFSRARARCRVFLSRIPHVRDFALEKFDSIANESPSSDVCMHNIDDSMSSYAKVFIKLFFSTFRIKGIRIPDENLVSIMYYNFSIFRHFSPLDINDDWPTLSQIRRSI